MPEIVELKIFANSIRDRFADRKVTDAACYKGGLDLRVLTAGKILTDVQAHGKELFFWLNGVPAFSVHLMLHGGFNVLNENLRPAAVDLIAEWRFENGEYLILYDPDGYAKIGLFASLPDVPEATAVTEDAFLQLLEKKKASVVKNVLCDQKCLRGIGNAYADEILYTARIAPSVKIKAIPPSVRQELYRAMRSVLENAIGTYGKKYRGALNGEMRDLVRVHTRARMTPDGEIIHCIDLGGKKTYYTDSQRKFDR